MAYLTLGEARTYIGLSPGDSSSDNDLIEDLFVPAAQKFLEDQTGLVFEAATETRYYRREHLSGQVLNLDRPCLTVTTLTNGDGSEITSGYYWLIPRNSAPYHQIELKSTKVWAFDTDAWISVAGTWGFSATVPNDVKHAMLELVNLLYKGKDSNTLGGAAFVSGGQIVIREGLPPWTTRVIRNYRQML